MRCINKKLAQVNDIMLLIIEKGLREHTKTILFIVMQNLLKIGNSIVLIVFTKELLNGISKFCDKEYILICFGGIVVSMIITHIFDGIINSKIVLDEKILRKEMEIRLGEHTAQLPYSYVESLKGQEELEKAYVALDLTGGVFENSSIIVETVIEVFSMLFWVLYIGEVSWIFLVLILLICLIRIAIKKREIKYDKTLCKKNAMVLRKYRYIFEEMFSNNAGKVIRVFKGENFIGEEGTSILNSAFDVLQENCDMIKKNNIILQFLNIVCLMLTIIYSFRRAIQNHMIVGDFTLFISAFNKMIDYGVRVFDNFNQFIENASAYQDYINYMNIKEEDNKGITIQKIKTIEFKDVSFKYPQGQKEVLSHINFYIDMNHKMAIIGKNGSGKSTIVKLLLGFYRPTQGEILVNGISIEKIDMNVYRSRLEVVDQDFRTFEGSIIENVVCSNEIKNTKFDDCVKKANIYKKISELELKEQTFIGRYLDDSGVRLSGGERQKVCISRALYNKGDMLILDEPTSALDVYSRENFNANFMSMTDEKIVIYISHNIESCLKCDNIIILQNGKIIEKGEIKELNNNKNSVLHNKILNESVLRFRI